MPSTRTLDHQLREILDDRRSFTEELDEISSAFDDGVDPCWDEQGSFDGERGGADERDAFSGESF